MAELLDLTVVKAEYLASKADDAPFLGYGLHLVLAGGDNVYIDCDQKQTLVDAGWVFLGSDFEGRLGPNTVTFSDGGGEFWGFTDDATILALTRKFLSDLRGPGDMLLGPVEVLKSPTPVG